MTEAILVAQSTERIFLLPKMANRHGLIAGATGTGKTVTLQALAENFSARGVPVFVADAKGDLAGLTQPGGKNPKIVERARELKIDDFRGEAYPVVFWDVFGEDGLPVRATVSEMGPLLLPWLLELNENQEGVLNVVFRVADENGLLLLDLKANHRLILFKDRIGKRERVGDDRRQSQQGRLDVGMSRNHRS